MHKTYRPHLYAFYFWSIVYWGASWYLGRAIVSDLVWQLLFGHVESINTALWFMVDLAAITLGAGIFFYIIHDKQMQEKGLTVIIIVSLLLEYFDINYTIFINMPYEVKFTLGRLCEMMPYAALGLLCARRKWIERVEITRTKTTLIVARVLLTVLIPRYDISGYGYQGIMRIVSAILLLIYFGTMRISREKYQKSIKKTAQYTMGIYCVHLGIGWITTKLVNRLSIQMSDMFKCVVIWGLCVLFVILCSKIPFRVVKKILN